MTQTILRDYLLTTEDAISSGRINDALANCQYILTHFPESLEAQRLLGEVYLAQGQLDEAQQTFDWVLTNDPENVIVYCDRALISEQLHDYDTALDCYQQAYELSRGNSEIRHEFNQLSEKVGQTGFIFSRAGLARLYMRGDLLPQAIQEWEIVLSASPDRLDARTGLLETLWREGLYDQVEQFATQILNDVPGCLKALLLLAHVTFAQNALKAQELMRVAATLDPDFVKAQELFSDFMANSPKDPFLNLLKKSPTAFPDTSNGTHAATTPTEQVASSANGTNGSHGGTAPFNDPLVRWSSLDNIIEPQQEYQTVQEAAPFGNWADASSSDFGGWSAFAQQPQQSTQPAPAPAPAAQTPTNTNQSSTSNTLPPASQHQVQPEEEVQDELQAAVWQMPPAQEIEKTNDTPITQQNSQEQSWYQVDVFEEPALDSWNSGENLTQSSSGISWGMDEQEAETPTPPAWLDMLTSDRRQPANPTPQVQSTVPTNKQQTPVEPPPAQQEPTIQKNDLPIAWSDQQPVSTPTSQPSFDDEEGYSFGPEWLKSLGATAIESGVPQSIVQEEKKEQTPPSALPVQPLVTEQTPIQEQPPLVEAEAEQLPASTEEDIPLTTPVPAELVPTTIVVTPSTPSVEPPPVPVSPVPPSEREKVSVENWLDHAAQLLAQPEQNILTTLEELENDLRSQGFTPLEPGSLSSLSGKSETDEATLSSALAQLGRLEPQPQSQPQLQPQPVNEAIPAQSVQQHTPVTPHHLDALSSFISQLTPAVNTPVEPVRVDASTNNAVAQSSPNTPSSTVPPAASTTRSDLPLDTELETTMKRPAVRLQPMQQRYGSHSAQPASPGQAGQAISKGRSGERSTPGKAADGSMGHKERLVRGYQYQLAGAYDEAMQEYRIIIRNAPDLLSEIVSNMRALLKIAPKYSAGYRVLGDAYMRQGEYLQAMEAYNKALAMAKKVKS